jgi:hypothetical protein
MRSRNKKGHSLSDPQTAGFAGFFRRRAQLVHFTIPFEAGQISDVIGNQLNIRVNPIGL